jgi:hypothetical protein
LRFFFKAEMPEGARPGDGDEVNHRPYSPHKVAAASYSGGGFEMITESEAIPVVLTITPDEFQQIESTGA